MSRFSHVQLTGTMGALFVVLVAVGGCGDRGEPGPPYRLEALVLWSHQPDFDDPPMSEAVPSDLVFAVCSDHVLRAWTSPSDDPVLEYEAQHIHASLACTALGPAVSTGTAGDVYIYDPRRGEALPTGMTGFQLASSLAGDVLIVARPGTLQVLSVARSQASPCW